LSRGHKQGIGHHQREKPAGASYTTTYTLTFTSTEASLEVDAALGSGSGTDPQLVFEDANYTFNGSTLTLVIYGGTIKGEAALSGNTLTWYRIPRFRFSHSRRFAMCS
jgi:hypothetical protein